MSLVFKLAPTLSYLKSFPKMSHFLNLPTEVRFIIFGYCLIIGEINPYPRNYDRQEPMRSLQRKPDIALLQVNKLIRAEAEIVLYGKNVWRLSWDEWNRPLWVVSEKLVRKLIISFDVRDLDTGEMLELILAARDPANDIQFETLGDKCHEYGCDSLVNEKWAWKMAVASKMMLTDLTLDFTNCFCPSGCCRLIDQLDIFLEMYWATYEFHPEVKIIGGPGDEETEAMAKMGFECKGWASYWRRRWHYMITERS